MGYVLWMASKPEPLAKQIARGAVVAASASVFTRLGFAAARVEDILAAAGIARRTFYKYFTGKEEVLAALYEIATGELLKALASGVADGGDAMGGTAGRSATASATPATDALDAVQRSMDVYLDYHVDNAALLKVLVEQAIRSDSPLAEGRRRFRKQLVALIDQAVRARTGTAHDPMLYAALISALEGLSLDLLGETRPTKTDVDRAKAVMRLLIERVLAT